MRSSFARPDSRWRLSPHKSHLRCRFLAGRWSEPVPLLHRSPKFLPLLGTHVPASPAPSAPAMPSRPPMPQSSEQNPAQRQQSQRLPEAQRPPAEERRQQPVPQVHHHLRRPQRQTAESLQSPDGAIQNHFFLIVLESLGEFCAVKFVPFRKFVIHPLQPLPQMQHCIPLA